MAPSPSEFTDLPTTFIELVLIAFKFYSQIRRSWPHFANGRTRLGTIGCCPIIFQNRSERIQTTVSVGQSYWPIKGKEENENESLFRSKYLLCSKFVDRLRVNIYVRYVKEMWNCQTDRYYWILRLWYRHSIEKLSNGSPNNSKLLAWVTFKHYFHRIHSMPATVIASM